MTWFKKNFPDKKVRVRIFILLTILVLIFLFSSINNDNNNNNVMLRANDCLFKVEIADNNVSRYQGLSNRESLCSDCGMLFLFSEKKHQNFVMRNMNFPIDIIFIDNKEIVDIHKNAKPEGKNYQEIYSSARKADAVLEINASKSRECGLSSGDIITWSQ